MAYLGRQPNTGVRSRYIYTATASQTTFTGSDDDGKTLRYEDAAYLDVFLNGVLLKPVTDYTATSKTSVVLTSAAAVSDVVEIVAYDIANIANTVSATNGGTFEADVTVQGTVTADGLTVDGNVVLNDQSVEVGSTSNSYNELRFFDSTITGGTTRLRSNAGVLETYTSNAKRMSVTGDGDISFYDSTGTNQDLFWDASASSLLVGKTALNTNTAGLQLESDGYLSACRDGGNVALINRKTSDGALVTFQKDGSTVGSIGTVLNPNREFIIESNTGQLFCGVSGGSYYGVFDGDRMHPSVDNAMDLGASSARFDDIYATNGTIQTSDANEKQQIASLTDPEITAAKAISKLFKTFKWNDKVAEKGDAARTHTGVIAQDVQQAMTDAGLDAGNYAFWMSNTWWETQTEVPAVEAVDEVVDEEGNIITEAVEAKEAYTRTDTYDTAEEAPADATERTRLGIRYPELLAFIGAATEQRLTSIEARLATLENA